MERVIRGLITRIVLVIALIPFLLLLAQFARYQTFEIYGKKHFKYTYIRSINVRGANQILAEFNVLGNGKIVSFVEIPNGRPIDIDYMTDSDKKLIPGAIGISYPRLTGCTIHILRNLPYTVFRETLYHEYCHCFNYNHVADKNDLMYWSLNYSNKEANIKWYAQDIKRKFYE